MAFLHFAWVPVLSLHFYLYQYCFKERHGRLLAVLLVLLSRGNGWGWNIVRGEPSWHACDQYIKYYFKNHSIHHCCHEMSSHQILLWRFFCLHMYITTPIFALSIYSVIFRRKTSNEFEVTVSAVMDFEHSCTSI